MKTQTIEVEGLPEGWKAVAHRKPLKDEYILYGDEICKPKGLMNRPWLIVEKIQPRRISFDEITDGTQNIDEDYYIKYKWWREVKETTEDPKLSLNKKDMLELIEHIKLGGQLNHKIAEFIKENS